MSQNIIKKEAPHPHFFRVKSCKICGRPIPVDKILCDDCILKIMRRTVANYIHALPTLTLEQIIEKAKEKLGKR